MRRSLSLLAAALLVTATATAVGGKGASVKAKGSLSWTEAGIQGVATAAVEGDMAKGASHFYLRYASGLVTPLHHHSPDHYVTTLAGTLVLVVDGQEHRLPAGSFFSLVGKAPHVARCEGKEDCLMFIDARGPWDVVPETAG